MMYHFGRPILVFLFLSLMIYVPSAVLSDSQADKVSVTVYFNNISIESASTQVTAITMLNTGNVGYVNISVVGEESIYLEEIKTVFIVADLDVLDKKDSLGVTVSPGNNFTFIQNWEFDNSINEDFSLISGIYTVRYDVKYREGANEQIIRGDPFYIDFKVNPITSVFGAVSTIALAVTTFSAIKLVGSFSKSIPGEVSASINNAQFKASSELKSYYIETGLSKLQGEFANRIIRASPKRWSGEKCPECGTQWNKDAESCSVCGTTLDRVEEIQEQSLRSRALSIGADLAGSTDGLTLGQIAAQLGENVVPTADVLELLTFSGLAVVQPRLSKNWNKKTSNLLFTGIQWSLYSLFWINSCGITTVSLAYLGLAIASGVLLPIIIGRIYTKRIKDKIAQYWKKGGY